MNDIEKLKRLLKSGEPLICMLAPSFVADFDYPDIIWKIRKLGFDKVTELTFGAKMTNIYSHKTIRENPQITWISSPCPTIVQMIKVKYPHLLKNIIPVHSPMGCMGKICRKFYPKHKNVFVGPCITKKIEAMELDEVDLAITFLELKSLLEEKNLDMVKVPKKFKTFDKFYNDYTKIYPLAGGMASTLHSKKILKESEILIVDGINEIEKIFKEFKDGRYKNYRFLDILACKGGCIGGPGMAIPRSIKERQKRVIKYRNYARALERDLGRRGKIVHVEDIDFTRVFI